MMSDQIRRSPFKDISNRIRKQGQNAKRTLSLRSPFKKNSRWPLGYDDISFQSEVAGDTILNSEYLQQVSTFASNEDSPEAMSKYVPGRSMAAAPSSEFFDVSPAYKRGRGSTPSKNPVPTVLFHGDSNAFRSDNLRSEFNVRMNECMRQQSIEPFKRLLEKYNGRKHKGWLRKIFVDEELQRRMKKSKCKGKLLDLYLESIPVIFGQQLDGHEQKGNLAHAWGVSGPTIRGYKDRTEEAEQLLPAVPRFPIDLRDNGSPLLFYNGDASMEELQREVTALNENVSRLEAQLLEARQQIAQLQGKKHRLVENRAYANTARASAENREKLESERKKTKDMDKSMKKLVNETNGLKCELESYYNKCSTLEQECKSLKEEVAAHKPNSVKWLKAIEVLTKWNRYNRDDGKTDYFYGLAIAVAPALSRYAAEQVFVFVAAAVLNQIGMLEELGNEEAQHLVCRIVPKADTLGKLFRDFSIIQYCFIIRKLSYAKAVGMTFDKSTRGTTMNKVAHLIKIVSHWDEVTGKIEYYYIDFDGAEGTSKEVASQVVHTIKYRLLGVIKKIATIGGDNGGGDSGEPLCREFEYMGIMTRWDPLGLEELPDMNISNCALHNHNLMLVNAFVKVLGAPGIERRTVLQAIHAAYDLEKHLGAEAFRMMCGIVECEEEGIDLEEYDLSELYTEAKAPKAQGNAMTTRWNSLPEAAKRQFEEGEKIKKVANLVHNSTSTEKAGNKIASNIISLEREPVIQLDKCLLKLLGPVYTDWPYHELKKKGAISGESGFASEKVLEIMYLMDSNIERLSCNKWRADEKFQFGEYDKMIKESLTVDKLNAVLREADEKVDQNADALYNEEKVKLLIEQQGEKVNRILELAKASYDKHFVPLWINHTNILCALLAGKLVTRLIADCLVSENIQSSTFDNEVHRYHYGHDEEKFEDNQVKDLRKFVLKNCKKLKQIREYKFVKKFNEPLRLLAQGQADLFTTPACEELFEFLKNHFLIVASTNQPAELAFKLATKVNVHNRDEKVKSFYAVCHSVVVTRSKMMAFEQSQKDALAQGRKPKNKSSDVRGNKLAVATMCRAMYVREYAMAHDDYDDNRKKLTKIIEDKQLDAKALRTQLRTAQMMDKNKNKPTAPSARSKITGVEVTQLIGGRISITSILKKHIQLLQEELFARGLEPGRVFFRRSTFKELKELLKGTLDGDDPKDFCPKHQNLFDALTKEQTIVDGDEAENNDVDGEAENDEDDEDDDEVRYKDVFERCGVSMTKAVKIDDLKGQEMKSYLEKELMVRGITPTGTSITTWRNQLRYVMENVEKCFTPKSDEMKQAVAANLVPTTLVDDDFYEGLGRRLINPP